MRCNAPNNGFIRIDSRIAFLIVCRELVTLIRRACIRQYKKKYLIQLIRPLQYYNCKPTYSLNNIWIYKKENCFPFLHFSLTFSLVIMTMIKQCLNSNLDLRRVAYCQMPGRVLHSRLNVRCLFLLLKDLLSLLGLNNFIHVCINCLMIFFRISIWFHTLIVLFQ